MASMAHIEQQQVGETPLAMLCAKLGGKVCAGLANAAERAAAHWRAGDFATDLAEDLGSPRWYRGLGVMVGCGALALACAPGVPVLDAPLAMRLDAAAREQARSQTVMPFALGGDIGQRMGPTTDVTAMAFAPERPTIEMTATLTEGDSLTRMLGRAGIGNDDIARAEAAIAGAVPLGDIAPGTRFDLTLGRHDVAGTPRPLDRLAFRARFDLDLVVQRFGGGFAVVRHALPVDATPLRIRGVAGASLYHSARAAGAPMKAIQQFLAAIDAHLSLDDVRAGDTFDMVVTYKRAAGGESEVGDLLYAGITSGGRPKSQLLRWGGEGQFFDASDMAEQRSSQALIMPVAGARVTSGFGLRFHPILGFSRMHSGTDLAAPWGSAIYAVADGVVAFVGPHGGHGNYVRLEHGGGTGTGYGHMSRFAVSSGMRVRAGQVIGYVGSTGLSTGPHLHYEVFRNGVSVDPMSMHFTVRNGVDKKELAAFKARLAGLMQVKPGAALGPIGGATGQIASRASAIAHP
jgi:murein DD-endopeptidase MepM/ murein hydrolase activator NlpD